MEEPFPNLVEMLDRSCRAFGDRPLFGSRTPDGWEWVSFAAFRRLVKKCQAGLHELGVRRGDRVAVIANNRIEWAVAAHATYGLGAAYVPMYESQSTDEWAYILADSGAKLCLVGNESVAARVTAIRASCRFLQHLVVMDGCSDGEGIPFAELLETGVETPRVRAPVEPTDVATIIYTSGTTGNPKGVELTHGNLATNVGAILGITPIAPGERSLGFLPWAHVYGGCVEMHTLIATGGSIAICGDPSKLPEYLKEVKPSLLFAVPRVWNQMYEGVRRHLESQPKMIRDMFHGGMRACAKERRGEPLTLVETALLSVARKLIFARIVGRFGGNLRIAFSGAAALSFEVAEFIDSLGIEVYEGYGMTEGAGVIASNRPGARRIGSVGKAVPGVEIRLDASVPGAGEAEGEILFRGGGVMAGYHGMGAATREAITEDGWLRTGDLGRFDAEGFLYITGRVKELFKLSNGRYVAPGALEQRLQLSPLISQCVVFGDGQPHVVALVVVDKEALALWARDHGVSRVTAEALSDLRTQEAYEYELAEYGRTFKGYERIRGFLLESEPLTIENGMLTPTLKVKRRSVLEQYGAELQSLYDAIATGRAHVSLGALSPRAALHA